MLRIEQLSASIAGTRVLRNVSMDFRDGETMALVGRNGAGKTTLLRAIMGLTATSGGSMRLDDIDLATIPAQARTRLGLGYAPEDRVLFPSFTVEENLRFPCEVLKLDKATIKNRLDEVLTIVPDLQKMLPRSAAALSGGQGKMVALGRAVMVGTRIVLLDEPFQGLAPVLATEYTAALSRLHEVRPGLCVFITESNRSLLKNIPDRTIILERGCAQELSADSNHVYEAQAHHTSHGGRLPVASAFDSPSNVRRANG